jgi:hypothetical protein
MPALSLYGPPPIPPPTTSYAPPPVPPPGPPPSGDLGFNAGVAVDRPLKETFWEKCSGWCGHLFHSTSGCSEGLFRSDQGFNEFFISPVTNPFYFADPRALTEVRPIFIYQHASNNNPVTGGGSSEFFGLQGSVAICEHFSFVFDKVGFVALQPNITGGDFVKATGVSELMLGPKWTFWRSPCTRTVAALGVNFDIPLGPHKVFQDTGTLAIDPYFTIAQGIDLRSFGSLNLMGELGYDFSVDDKRSEFAHSSFHIDYDVVNNHHWFPLFETNWYHYTRNGNQQPLTFEGTDLVNFGSRGVAGQTIVTLGPGLRYKFCEGIQAGAAAEWAVTNHTGISDFRLTFDLIFRY